MKPLYIVTGAAGHLGGTIVRALLKEGADVRGLVLPGEALEGAEAVVGDVRDLESLRPLFRPKPGREMIVIHTAGIVDISGALSERMYAVNVGGTKNIIALCKEYGVRRLVYVSSVHAIPESDALAVTQEVDSFCADRVEGGYAKTKAEATQAVLDAARAGLNAVVVHPSGILGPYDAAGNHVVQMLRDYTFGKLPACVDGGYDFVDVRDVAEGCILAAERGRSGECYILSNRHYEVRDILKIARAVGGGKKLLTLPMWMARAAVPLLAAIAKLRRERPLYTQYALATLAGNDRFAHDKATAELNYRPRDLYATIRDTIAWLRGRAGDARGAKIDIRRRVPHPARSRGAAEPDQASGGNAGWKKARSHRGNSAARAGGPPLPVDRRIKE